MKLLAIDDNPAVLHQLQIEIEAERMGISRIDTACSAAEARARIGEEDYDIVLCDIEMPGEDGISLAKWLLGEKPWVKLIFLTSHADFSYMKQAIAMHSFDYLLQPTIASELNQVIQKAIFEIKADRKKQELLSKAELFDEQEKHIVDWAILQYLEKKEPIDDAVVRLIQNRYKIPKESDKVALFTIHTYGENHALHKLEGELVEFVLTNIFDELSERDNMRSLFLRKGTDSFIGMAISTQENPDLSILHERLKSLRHFLSEIYDTDVVIYFTGYEKTFECHELYDKMEGFLEKKLFKKGEVLCIEDESEEIDEGKTLEGRVRYWKSLLLQKKYQSVRESVFFYLDRVSLAENFNLRMMIEIHAMFTEIFLAHMLENNIESTQIFGQGMTYTDYMHSYKSVELFKETVLYVTEKMQTLTHQNDDPVKRVMRYVRDNIEKDISVGDLATYVSLSPEHLTRLIKKETGYSLKEYLTFERLNAAKMLLETTSMTVTQVADHVGYSNYNNFSKIFKKYENCTPSEYRSLRER